MNAYQEALGLYDRYEGVCAKKEKVYLLPRKEREEM